MYVITEYSSAILVMIITMLCWGSWPVTQRFTNKNWRFELYYWDYVMGLLLGSLLIGFTLGSVGEAGRGFIDDLTQAESRYLLLAVASGLIFNIGNLLFVAAITYSGMAVAFPVGGGLALVLGVLTNYLSDPYGNGLVLFCGVLCILAAMFFTSRAYTLVSKNDSNGNRKGLLLAIAAGCFFGFFFRLLSASLAADVVKPEEGKLTSYTAISAFALGAFLSSIPLNGLLMRKPLKGPPIKLSNYEEGTFKDHFMGLLGGILWCIGLAGSLLASSSAGSAVAFGLSQGNAMVAAIWGVFIWKEFAAAGRTANKYIFLLFLFYITGLALIAYSGRV